MTQRKDPVLNVGDHIGVYEIRKVIRVDRSGFTYNAWNDHLNTSVTVKEYFPADFAVRLEDGRSVEAKSENDADMYEYGLKAFLRQGETLSEIHHHGITGVHNVLQFNNTAYLVMDHEQGVAISDLHGSLTPFNEHELKTILLAVLDALRHLHEKGSAHGDIHPGNILIRTSGDPVLINFAAPRLVFATKNNLLLQDLRSGYTPPELYSPNNLPNPVSDLYSLGATIYRCITDIEPCLATQRKDAENKTQPDPLQPLADLADSDFSKEFINIIQWMLRPNAEERPQYASDVLTALHPQVEQKQTADTRTLKPDNRETAATQPSAGFLIGRVVAIAVLIAAGFWYLQLETPQTPTFKPAAETTASSSDRPKADTKTTAGDAQVVSGQTGQQQGDNDITPSKVKPLRPQPTATVTAKNETAATDSEPRVENRDAATAEASAQQPVDTDNKPSVENAEAASQSRQQTEETSASIPKQAKPLSKAERKQQLIDRHLAQANQDIAAFRLTTPPENSAYMHYLAVFEMDPDNAQARKGLRRIVDKYILLIERTINERRFDKARVYLERADAVMPDDPNLTRLHKELFIAEQQMN